MQTLFRLVFSITLVVSLGLFGVQAHAGLGSEGNATTIVICAGESQQTIMVDANGNPVEPSADCSHCPTCFAPASGLIAHAMLLQASAQSRKLTYLGTNQITPRIYNTRPQTRGPPSVARHKGACAVPGFGPVCKDTTA